MGFFSTPPSNSPTPVGCPRIQCHSDTIYPERASDPPKLRGQACKTCITACPTKKKQTILQMSILTGYRLEVPLTPSFSSINLFEQLLTVFTETSYSLGYQLIIKGYNSELTRWQRCTGWGMSKGQDEVWVNALSKHTSLPKSLHNQGRFLNPILLGLWRLYYIGMAD